MLAQMSKMFFIAKTIKLPVDWSQPGDQYPDAFKPGEKGVAPNSPMNLFREASLNKYHVDSAKTVGDQFSAYIDGISRAICQGIQIWMNTTVIAGVMITGPVGIVKPGSIIGPNLTPLIMAAAPKATPQELKYSQAISSAFGSQWQMWHMMMTGILNYPAFASFPGPMAPPTPNVPAPVLMFPSSGEAGLSLEMLGHMMSANLGDPKALHASELFDSIASGFSCVFQTFKSSTLITNVYGTGPIPTFAPPFVPVGPVVMGNVIPTPGVFV